MRGEQAIFNLEIKKKSGLSINPDIQHLKVFSSVYSFNIKKNFFYMFQKSIFISSQCARKSQYKGHSWGAT